ncbi:type VI secretion system tip protein VgrG [Acetobacter okinawensis]|uniref:type VI secretion system Vgr family protein n=1 Tax=Acetobacter okinawensis TaxID=1076594 RepID=UPI001BA8AD49|nr:type VI secretion system tip protein TssI/VgrG [Acetobacter okinawensis]MBS0964501.1 type VI secretion system tip protein VgrG [Acetobacter okinawensis]
MDLELLSIVTPLRDAPFGVARVHGTEELSHPFIYQVHLHSGADQLDSEQLLDQAVSIQVARPRGGGAPARYINGIVSSVVQDPMQGDNLWSYTLTVVPRLWFLGQTSDCRFYQQMSVPEIASQILSHFGITCDNRLTLDYTPRDYIVQFNESYLDFLQRLLEDCGIFYFFIHDEHAHRLILADANTAFPAMNPYALPLDQVTPGLGVMQDWDRADITVAGRMGASDYNPATGTASVGTLQADESTLLKASGAESRVHYVWPATRDTRGGVTDVVKTRMQAAEAVAELYEGSGQVPAFFAGGRFLLQDDPFAGGGSTDYVVRSLSYDVSNGQQGGAVGIRLTAFRTAVAYRPDHSFAPPVMAGLYSALVIGPQGEEVHTDDLGRIKVQFPSDHMRDISADKTLWVRVMHPWAGNGWGMQHIPRVGTEVAIAFLEGDVNRPVVVGGLYNARNAPIFPAAEKTRSGWRSRSMDGGRANFSEFSVDDAKGREAVLLHAERDLVVEVEHDRSVAVTHDENVRIDGNKTDTVRGDHATTVSEGNLSVDVCAGAMHCKAAQSITLQVGGSTIVIDPSGISLSIGDSKMQLTAASVSVESPQVTISGQALLQLSGGVTMINS